MGIIRFEPGSGAAIVRRLWNELTARGTTITLKRKEVLRFIQAGGVVSMTGDQVWNPGQRTVAVSMLGHELHLPEMPHGLAMLSGAPLLLFFSRRKGRKRYQLALSEPLHNEKTPRRFRAEAIRQSAQRYADLLETHLRANPFEWYHFEPFLGPKLT